MRTILKHRPKASNQTRRAVALAGLAVGLVLAAPAAGQTGPASDAAEVPRPTVVADPFLVRGVPVDVTAGSVIEARERGLTQARVAAFRRLIERMTLRESWDAIVPPPTADIIDMVLEFSVANERSSAVRYLAELNVRFDPAAVRAFLRAQNVAFAETPSDPLVVLPLYQDGPAAAPELWQDTNPWREAWAASLPNGGLVPFLLPLGDLQDIALVSADQAAAAEREAVLKLADKYAADGVLIARAIAAGETSLNVALTELRVLGEPWTGEVAVTLAADKPREEALKDAVAQAMRPIEDNWKQRHILRFGAGGRLTALIPVTGLQDWLSVKARLARVPVVERVDLEAISKTLVQVVVAYAGDEEQLQFAMKQYDLDLVRDGELWLLRSIARGAPAAPAPAAAAAAPSP